MALNFALQVLVLIEYEGFSFYSRILILKENMSRSNQNQDPLPDAVVLYKVPEYTKPKEIQQLLVGIVPDVKIIDINVHTPSQAKDGVLTAMAFVKLTDVVHRDALMTFYREDFNESGIFFTNDKGISSKILMSYDFGYQTKKKYKNRDIKGKGVANPTKKEMPKGSRSNDNINSNFLEVSIRPDSANDTKNLRSNEDINSKFLEASVSSQSADNIKNLMEEKIKYEKEKFDIIIVSKFLEEDLKGKSSFFISELELHSLQKEIRKTDLDCENLEQLINKTVEECESMKRKLEELELLEQRRLVP